ncbi:MAG: nucleotidyltransferase substrate binding protein [Acidobacteria bacterium]|nr:nucleotidyltransferase substrate binding protein [Acidobacteriota bacterium]
MERIKERIKIARQALSSLKVVLLMEKTTIVRDAAIQRFEYTFEAVWKSAQMYLKIVESLEAGSPKSSIRMSFQVGLLDEETARMAMIMADDRNLTVHTYNESLAEQIYSRIGDHAAVMTAWLDAMDKKRTLQPGI